MEYIWGFVVKQRQKRVYPFMLFAWLIVAKMFAICESTVRFIWGVVIIVTVATFSEKYHFRNAIVKIFGLDGLC